MELRPDATQEVTIKAGGEAAVDTFAYKTEYGAAGITFSATDGVGTYTINTTTLATYTDSTKVGKLTHESTAYVGIQFTKPSRATKVAVSLSPVTSWGEATQLKNVFSNSETGVYNEQYLDYFPIGTVSSNTITAGSTASWTLYFKWLNESNEVVGYTQATVSRAVTPSGT